MVRYSIYLRNINYFDPQLKPKIGFFLIFLQKAPETSGPGNPSYSTATGLLKSVVV